MKIKWKNVIKLGILALCSALMLFDAILIVITMSAYTWFGLLTFILCALISDYLIDDILGQIKSVPNIETVMHTNK